MKNRPSRRKLKAKVRFNEKSEMYSKTDPNGSYTGTPHDKNEKPIQDADDL